MKLLLGFATCLLVGCAARPTDATPVRESGAMTALAGRVDLRLDGFLRGNHLRIGVEFLPPANAPASNDIEPLRVESVQDEPRRSSVRAAARALPERRTAQHTWTMNAEDLASLRDPVARETMMFLDDLMGEDRRRLKRDLGTPILTMQSIDLQSPGIDLRADELQAEDEALWMTEHGVDLLRRPLQKLLRRLPFVRGVEVSLDRFKEENVPLSEAYGKAHSTADLGRVSMRVRPSDAKDPVELVYIRPGFRVGSSQEQIKLALTRDLTDDVSFSVRARNTYGEGHWRLRADVSLQLSEQSSLHFTAGDNLDFLTTSTVYSLFESPMDGSPGLLIYALHLF